MAEYLIQEEILVELADIIRERCEYYDTLIGLVAKRDKITKIKMPDSTTIIRDCAFSNCTSLESITISDSVTRIGADVFFNCTSLTDMYLHPITPPSLYSIGAISTATTAIHVPIGSGDAYKSATNWSNFADIIVEDIVIE